MLLHCCCFIGIYFFILGSVFLQNTGTIASPVLVRIFRSYLSISLWYSFYHESSLHFQVPYIPQLATLETIPLQLLVAYLKCLLISEVAITLLYSHLIMIWVWCQIGVGVESTFSLFLVLLTLYIRGTYWARYSAYLEEWLTNSGSIAARLWQKRRIVEFGLGMVGSIVFQSFVKLTSMEQVVGVLLFAMVWVCASVVILPCTDFGILSFLLGNVILGCTVNMYGMKQQTWIVYAVCVFVFWLHSKLKIWSFAYIKSIKDELELPSEENCAFAEILTRASSISPRGIVSLV